jgi:hypothetical protein
MMTEGDYEFFRFISKYGKAYSTQTELTERQQIFKRNLEYIQNKNAQKGVTYQLGVNKFADLTNEEFKKRLGRKRGNTTMQAEDFKILDDSNLPDFIDWRQKGAVNWV